MELLLELFREREREKQRETSQPADKVKRNAGAGACGLTSG